MKKRIIIFYKKVKFYVNFLKREFIKWKLRNKKTKTKLEKIELRYFDLIDSLQYIKNRYPYFSIIEFNRLAVETTKEQCRKEPLEHRLNWLKLEEKSLEESLTKAGYSSLEDYMIDSKGYRNLIQRLELSKNNISRELEQEYHRLNYENN